MGWNDEQYQAKSNRNSGTRTNIQLKDMRFNAQSLSKEGLPWLGTLKRMSRISTAQQALFNNTGFVPNATLVLTEYEVDEIKTKFINADLDEKIRIYTTTEGLSVAEFRELLKYYPIQHLSKLEKALG